MIGSPAYMSPEQVEGDVDQIGPQSDVYSLGVILYELLTGQIPFKGSIGSVMGQILTAEPTPPIERRADIEPELQAICMKMMSKSAGDRFSSMSEVSAALTSYLKSAKSTESMAGLKSVATKHKPPKAEQTTEDATPVLPIQTDTSVVARLASQCLQKHDYAQAVELLHGLSESDHTERTKSLLDQATELQDEVDFLTAEMDQAIGTGQFEGIEDNVKRLLKLKPGHRRAKQLLQQLKTGEGSILQTAPSSSSKSNTGPNRSLVAGIAVVAILFIVTAWWAFNYFTDSQPAAKTNTETLIKIGTPLKK